ncbi:hypothetical protein E4U53_000318 [Claviceps sorghi]|nr:hypothetical protein E4U53_000318 [Claviceps sorghi]
MSPGPKSYSRVAHVEDADEDSGSSINGKPGTRKYATSGAPLNPSKANTSRSRSDKRPVVSRSSSAAAALNDSDSRRAAEHKGKPTRQHSSAKDCGDPELRAKDREQQRRDRRLREEEKDREQQRKDRTPREDEKDRKAKAKANAIPAAAKDESRPPRPRRSTMLSQSAAQPAPNPTYKRGHVDDADAAGYGLQQPAMSGTRPRTQLRTASYHAGQPYRPPPVSMSMMWHPPHQAAAPFPIGTFPPPIWQGYGTSPGGFAAPPPPSPVGPAPEYYDGLAARDPHSHLRQRFETRPGSAMGFQKPPPPPPPPPSTMDYYDSQDYLDDPPLRCPVARRPSRFQRAENDRRQMPPPDFVPTRPQSALPPSTSFRPPSLQQRPPSRQSQARPPVTQRRTVNFADQQAESDDDASSNEEELFHDISPSESLNDRHAIVARARRGSTAYDHRNYDIVPASTRRRRSSTYGSNALASGGVSLGEKKYNEALRYQEEVSGNPQMPLTAEYLKKAGRPGGVASSRSTRSSGSRDDSDYKRSNATGITHASSNTEDWNIKISGNARVRFPGAEIECGDNAEIVFTAPGGGGGSRLGSDKASMIHPQLEDARSRSERKALPHRPRAPSQSDSQSRSYAPSHTSYAHSGASF